MELYWAISTWILFHTLIEKTSDPFYINNYKEMFTLIKKICDELHCPICRKHASEYLNNININELLTKEMFKRMLYDFHNDVNKRLGKPHYSYSKLISYKNYDMSTVLINFRNFYCKSYGGILQLGLSSNKNNRVFVCNQVMNWFKIHWGEFNH